MNPVNVPALAESAHPVVELSNGTAITSSIEVARVFGKQHKDVLRAIENLQSDLGAEHKRNFAPMSIAVDIGNGATRQSPAYQLTRDGFTLLAMGFTGKKALAFKLAYIDAFNRMEAGLAGRPVVTALPEHTRQEMSRVIQQLSATNQRLVAQAQAQAQAQTTFQRITQDNTRMQQAHDLAQDVARQVAAEVFAAAMAERQSSVQERWLLTIAHRGTKTPPVPSVTAIESDACVLSIANLLDGLQRGDVGLGLSNQHLSLLAQVSLDRIARRASPQTGVNV